MNTALTCRFFALLALVGCTRAGEPSARPEPSFVTVTLTGELGSEELPLAFSTETVAWPVTVQALDREGDPYAFNGDLKIRVRPGRLDMDPWVSLTDGVWTGDVSIHAGFGPTRIWFSDEGDKASDSTRAPTWATGASEPLWYAKPTIREMQTTTDTETNALEGEFAELRVADRQVAITAIGANGFWVTDLADDPGTFNSLFVYTFNAPQDVALGDRITVLTGGNNEYLATTQLSWPTYTTATDQTLPLPDPVVLSTATACDDLAMEGLEAAVVQVDDATIPDTFVEGSLDYDNWLEYGQWPISFGDGSCTIYVSSDTAAPDFSPLAHVGENLGTVYGLVSQIWTSWVLVPRSADDLGAAASATARTAGPAPYRPTLPRPRPAPQPRAQK